MPKQRYIDTRFWSDGYIVSLNPLERYFFIYLLTNEHTNIGGIYELPIRVIAFESGLDESVIPNMLKKFQNDKKIFYIEEWVIICNFPKHQEVERSPKIRKGIENVIDLLPEKVRYAIDTLSIPYTYPLNYPNPNPNYNPNGGGNKKEGTPFFNGEPLYKVKGVWKIRRGVNDFAEFSNDPADWKKVEYR